MRRLARIFLLFLLFPASIVYGQESYQVDLSEIEKEIAKAADKPYSFGGFFEFQPILLGIDRDSAVSRVRLFKNPPGAASDQHNFRLRLEGSYKKDIFAVFFKTDTHVQNAFDRWGEETRLFEAYTSIKPASSFIFEAGKKVMKWGKGYAWNPVSFIDRPKNPEDPEEALEGSTVATADYIRSFDGPLKTMTLTAAAIPVYRYVNAKFGELYHTNFAAKLYLLAYDTDLDFMVFAGSSRPTRYGFDFSRNLGTNFEIHGEFAVIDNFESPLIDENGQGSKRRSDAVSFLLGLRYLTEQETTYILEYYQNGTGYSRDQMRDFFTFVERSYRTFVNTGNETGLIRSSGLARGPYGAPNPMRHYIYFRASQKEPFDILYFTPALTSIVNVTDGSLVVIPELAYSPLTNLEMRLRCAALIGAKQTDYGEKQNDYRIELRLRYFFQL
jgi:hypothetical protein